MPFFDMLLLVEHLRFLLLGNAGSSTSILLPNFPPKKERERDANWSFCVDLKKVSFTVLWKKFGGKFSALRFSVVSAFTKEACDQSKSKLSSIFYFDFPYRQDFHSNHDRRKFSV
jgi:hypothetical protein